MFKDSIPNSSYKGTSLLSSLDYPRLDISKIKCLKLVRSAPTAIKMGDPLTSQQSLLLLGGIEAGQCYIQKTPSVPNKFGDVNLLKIDS